MMLSKNGNGVLKIQLTKSADADLKQAHDFIARDNVPAAEKTIFYILGAIDYLPKHPNIGRTGRVPHTRELVVSRTPFIIIYKIHSSTIFVLRILHAARKWP